MRILIITQRWYPDTFGGSEHVAARQARMLGLRGHHVTVLTERARQSLPAESRENNLRIYRYGAPKGFPRMGGRSRTDLEEVPKIIRSICEETAKNPWDAAILHHPFSAAGFFTANLKIPTLYIFHASTASEADVEGVRRKLPPLIRWFAKKSFARWASYIEGGVLRQVSRIAVFSDFSGRILRKLYPAVAEKIVKIPIGIDTDAFHPAPSKRAVRSRLGLSPDSKIILTVRRITPRMGLEALVGAMDEVARHLPGVQLLIVGDGPLKETVKRKIARMGLQKKVTLVGAVSLEDLPLYYQAADLFVLPTAAYEGLGMATLEAFASGLPVVGTPAGATPEVLGDLSPSLILKSVSVQDIAAGIVAYFARPEEEREALGRKARELAEKKYQWENATSKLEVILEKLMV